MKRKRSMPRVPVVSGGKAHSHELNEQQQDSPEHDGIIRRDFGFEIKADTLNEANRSVRMIASTNAEDSYGDVVEQHWDLSRYNKNPLVLYNHNRSTGGGFFGGGSLPQAETIPVGRSISHEVVGGRLEFEPKFSDDRASPLAERVWQGILQEVLRTASVGFRPGAVERILDHEGKPTGGYRLGSPTEPNVLVEISIVPIPANPEAVTLSGDHDYLERLAQRSMLNNAADAAEGSTMPPEIDNTDNPEQVPPAVAPVPEVRSDDAAAEKRRVADLEAKLAAQDAELATLRAANETAENERATAAVEALMGKKLVPASREAALKLRKLDRALFEELTASLPDLPMTLQVVRDQPPAEQVRQYETADQRLAAEARSDAK